MKRYLCLIRKYRIKFWFLRNSMKKWLTGWLLPNSPHSKWKNTVLTLTVYAVKNIFNSFKSERLHFILIRTWSDQVAYSVMILVSFMKIWFSRNWQNLNCCVRLMSSDVDESNWEKLEGRTFWECCDEIWFFNYIST